jgi:hypothetical protein
VKSDTRSSKALSSAKILQVLLKWLLEFWKMYICVRLVLQHGQQLNIEGNDLLQNPPLVEEIANP